MRVKQEYFCPKCGVSKGVIDKRYADKLCRKCCKQTPEMQTVFRECGRKSSANIMTGTCANCQRTVSSSSKSGLCKNCYSVRWKKKNPQKRKISSSRHYAVNRAKIIRKSGVVGKQKYKVDIAFRLKHNLRSRLNRALKNDQKTGSAVRDLGCSIEELKAHLESKFLPGMTWDNWAKDGWHIDHIRPLSSFNLQDPEEFKKACHYMNLQPLWAEENLKKGKIYGQ